MSERMSEDMPERISEDMPERMSERMSEDMPERDADLRGGGGGGGGGGRGGDNQHKIQQPTLTGGEQQIKLGDPCSSQPPV